MKVLAILFLVITTQLYAGVIESGKMIGLGFNDNTDAKALYNSLALPIDFGTLVTGVKHQYKSFQDKDNNFLIYCAQNSKNNYECFFSINKTMNGDLAILENDDLQIHVQLNDYDQTLKLYNSLNVPIMKHGTYYIKVLADENNTMGISCMTDSSTFAEYQCDFRIFK